VYVDDILITGDDTKGIDSLKKYLQKLIQTKDLRSLKYILGIEVARSKKGILLSRRKDILDLLSKARMQEYRFSDGREHKVTTRSGGAS